MSYFNKFKGIFSPFSPIYPPVFCAFPRSPQAPWVVNSATVQYEPLPYSPSNIPNAEGNSWRGSPRGRNPTSCSTNCFHMLRSNILHSEFQTPHSAFAIASFRTPHSSLRLPTVACMATTSQSFFTSLELLGCTLIRTPNSEFRICVSTIPHSQNNPQGYFVKCQTLISHSPRLANAK